MSNAAATPATRPAIWSRLRTRVTRVTSSGDFIPEIDGLRFFAIASVVLFHLAGYLAQRSAVAFAPSRADDLVRSVLHQGHYGVPLFFAISGFILMVPFAAHHLVGRDAPSLGRYLARRVTRLEPPYLVNLLVAFALLVLINGAHPRELLPHLLASSVYLHDAIYGEASLLNSVTWSLEVEVQFYLVAPLLAGVFVLRSRALRRTVLIAGAAALALAVPALPVTGANLLAQLPYFLVGALLADVYLADWQRAPERRPRWDVLATLAALAGVAAACLELAPSLVLPPVIFVLYVGAFRGPIWNRIVRSRGLVIIGGMCYTIYLYHYMIISAIARLTTRLALTRSFAVNFVLQAALVVPVVLAASAVLFAVLERPFMQRDWPARWRRALSAPLGRGRRAPASSAAGPS